MIPDDPVPPAGNPQPDDVELIRRIKSGDKLAFSDFYDRLSAPLYSVALRILGDQSEAEKVVEDVFLIVWENVGSFDQARGSVLNWVVTLTRNHAVERLRTRPQGAIVDGESSRGALLGADPATDPISADDWIFKEKIVAVHAALAALPADQVQTLEQAYFSGLDLPKLAALSNEPASAVSSRIRRALLKLRDLLTRRHD